jgi:hypothetical protein
MSRPSRKTVSSGLESWDGDMDDNFGATFDTPFPPAEYANASAFPSAGFYEGCIVRALDEDILYVERGGEWIPLAPMTKYSTSERNSGLKWTDGSTIYRKTINLGAMPNAAIKNVTHSIVSLDRIIKIEGMVDNGTNQYPLPAVVVNSGTFSEGIEVFVTDTLVKLETTIDWSSYTGYLTIYYLKSS